VDHYLNELWPVQGTSFESFTHLLKKSNLLRSLKAYRKLEGYASLARSPFLPPAVAADLRA
jgi:hypothetical protein